MDILNQRDNQIALMAVASRRKDEIIATLKGTIETQKRIINDHARNNNFLREEISRLHSTQMNQTANRPRHRTIN